MVRGPFWGFQGRIPSGWVQGGLPNHYLQNKAKRFTKQQQSNVIKASLRLFVLVCIYLRGYLTCWWTSYSALLLTGIPKLSILGIPPDQWSTLSKCWRTTLHFWSHRNFWLCLQFILSFYIFDFTWSWTSLMRGPSWQFSQCSPSCNKQGSIILWTRELPGVALVNSA